MTRAPDQLLAARSLLLTHLNVDKGRVRDSDLEPAEVGIVGDSAHRGGYHCGSDRVVSGDYSVVESPRDKAGLTLDAAALDVGQFSVTVNGRTHNLRTFSTWCAGQCAANAADTRDIREIIYSPDGKVVRRWDRLGRRSSGDSSHLWHTHFSFFRDAIKAGRGPYALFKRYLITIGILEDNVAWTEAEKAQMNRIDERVAVIWEAFRRLDGRNPLGQVYTRMALGEDHVLGPEYAPIHPSLRDLGAKLDALIQASGAEVQRDADLVARLEAVQRGELDPKVIVDELLSRFQVAPPAQDA